MWSRGSSPRVLDGKSRQRRIHHNADSLKQSWGLGMQVVCLGRNRTHAPLQPGSLVEAGYLWIYEGTSWQALATILAHKSPRKRIQIRGRGIGHTDVACTHGESFVTGMGDCDLCCLGHHGRIPICNDSGVGSNQSKVILRELRRRGLRRHSFEGRLGEYCYSGYVTRIAPLGDKLFAANISMIKRLARNGATVEIVSTAAVHEQWGSDEWEAEIRVRRKVEEWIQRSIV
jgi:hypothetical protein